MRSPLNYPDIRDLTLRVEKLGFDSVHVNDHLIGFDATRDKKETYLESVMLLATLATETQKVKLGHIVLCNSFRNPTYLAKMISTLDNISNGRALLQLGAGWYEEEYKAYEYHFPTPKRRVDELEESLMIYKKMFTELITMHKISNYHLNLIKELIRRNISKKIVSKIKNRVEEFLSVI